MLKIKDNVDLKELEKYGFHDNHWGAYIKNVEVQEGRYSKNVNISVRNETKEIEMYVPSWSKHLDCLYDLIKDGLVEKVDGRINMKTIKIIDLFIKIAKGEEIPKRVKYDNYIWVLIEQFSDYWNDEQYLFIRGFDMSEDAMCFLNDEVEIIEE